MEGEHKNGSAPGMAGGEEAGFGKCVGQSEEGISVDRWVSSSKPAPIIL